MPFLENMSIDERRTFLHRMQCRYREADLQGRSQLLNEMEAHTHMHRKSLIRLMRGDLERQPRHHQRSRSYTPEVDDALRLIHESFDYICAERLTPNLVTMTQQLAHHGEMTVSHMLLAQLEHISSSTVRRILQRVSQDQPRRRRKPPRSTSTLAKEIPVARIPWDEPEPGHFEIDMVYHCGQTTSGDFMRTMQMIDVATGWSERAATLGCSAMVMQDASERIRARLPFPVIELHPDNGSEFLNWHMIPFWRKVFQGLRLSRSFPYHKNDNRFVEQKNSTLVRYYLGFDRLDSIAQVNAVNYLYDQLWLYNNFFQPVMHLQEKKLVQTEGRTRLQRRYDDAQTPFDRLCTKDVLPPAQIESLSRLRDQTNPRRLREQIYDLIDHIFRLPNAQPGEYEDVALTLCRPLNSPLRAAIDQAQACVVTRTGCGHVDNC